MITVPVVYIVFCSLQGAINLTGKGLSCRESRCRIVTDLARIAIEYEISISSESYVLRKMNILYANVEKLL